ncbi:sodium-dependent transporter [Clostridium formicaceticum]|uniref:Sodium-dependent transporter n=1 Tax=Clostridium formicaceticum TaxID=1497 RepID=A0AAC9RLZ2_9CLOT|nr:sodium-dependent transporter [Clostridium formicaceticum]AOY75213.1 sodium-dependent transporter [Clostridium formicaceticum]ARE89646.1 Sodium:neurotransmitter symporter family protein [Clostridium formicaceticum]
MSQKKEQWGSRWGFIAASIGMAIGTGNIWRFPRVAAANGGGPFIIAWTIALFVWAIPLLMGEMVMGRKTGLGTIGAFRDFVGPKFTWMGTWIAVVCLGIMFYYSVVMGWCVKYFTLALSGAFKPGMTTEATEAVWQVFTTTPSQTILFHFISMALAGFIIYKGVTNGIEKASKIMIPTLFILLIVAVIRSLTLPGAAQGLEYLFSPKLEMLANPEIWLQAFTQAAWSTGAGWGFIITYSVYTSAKEDIAGNCLIMGFGDNLGALIAGMTVLPAIYALSPTQEFASDALASGNTGITFIYLAQLFTEMPAGRWLAAIFFASMAIAALSSLLPMIEVGVRNLMDMGLERKKSTLIIVISGFLLGVPSAYSLNFLDNQDWVWGIGLLVSGLFVAFALMKYGLEKARTEIINTKWSDFQVGKWWSNCVLLFPVFFVIITGWWLWQAITWYPDDWWNPFEVFSFGTIIFQFIILLLISWLTNNWLADKITKGQDITKQVS